MSIKQFCEQFDRVYCISLPRSTDRRAYITRYFLELGITNYEFFDATDKNDEIVRHYYDRGLVQTYPPCFRCGKLTCGRDDCNNILIPPQVATFISYLNLWRKIVAEDVGRALIVEDDVKFTEYAAEAAHALVNEAALGSIGFAADRAVLLRLGWAISDEHRSSTNPVIAQGLTRMSNPCHAITRTMAAVLLERFTRIETTVDIYQHIVVGETVENYTVLPPLSYELSWSVGAVASLIHPKPIRVSYLQENRAGDLRGIEAATRDLRTHFSHVLFRPLLMLGSPGSNTEYVCGLLSNFGLDVRWEKMGASGIFSWKFAVSDTSPYAEGEGAPPRQSVHFTCTVRSVRDPRAAIPSIIAECRRVPGVLDFCRRHILDRCGVDIQSGRNDVDTAVMIYVYWNQIVEDAGFDLTYREEDGPQKLRSVLAGRGVVQRGSSCGDSLIVSADKVGRADTDWTQVSRKNIESLNEQCRKYGYAEISNATGTKMFDEMLLIGGCPRSGTTILQHVLNTDPRVFISNEMNLFRIVDGLRCLLNVDAALADKRPDDNPRALSIRERWTVGDFRKYKFNPELTSTALKRIYEIHHDAVKPGATLVIFGDKFPKYYQLINQYSLAGSAFKYIHITRNPLDVVNSMIMRVRNAQEGKDTWKAHATLESQVAVWDEAFTFIRNNERDAKVLHVLYEDYVFNTVEIMEGIGEFLAMPLVWEGRIEDDKTKHFRRENIGSHELCVIESSGVYKKYVEYLQANHPGSHALEIAIEAEALFKASRKQGSNNASKPDESAVRNADRLTKKGEDLYSSGRLDEAREAFLEALRCAPGFVTARNNLGVMFWQEGDVEGALEHFVAALESDAADNVALTNLVEVLKSSGMLPDFVGSLETVMSDGRKASCLNDIIVHIRSSLSAQGEPNGAVEGLCTGRASPIVPRVEEAQVEVMNELLNHQGADALKSSFPDFSSRLATCRGFLQDRASERISKNHVFFKAFLGGREPLSPSSRLGSADPDCFGVLGAQPDVAKSEVILSARAKGKPVYIFENGFIRSVHTWVDGPHKPQLTSGISYVFDDAAAYYDATRPTRLEWLLENSPPLDERQIARVQRNIEFIQKNHLSKYNHQPIKVYKPRRSSNRNILVVDQSYNDYSVILGGADDDTFARMIDEAVNANPGADVYVKVHPDSMIGERDGRRGYYEDYAGHPRVTFITEPINPLCLIEPFDEVHVVTSQLGLEALLYGKRVVCHGMPFYAGWGLTDDKSYCARRTRRLTPEELFHYAYQVYTLYANPETNRLAPIEEAMDWLLMRRNEFFRTGK